VRIKYFRYSIILIFIIFFACRKETVTNWDVDITGPIVTSKLNIKNFLNDSLFNTDANGLLTLNVNREVAYVKVDSLLKLPDTTIVKDFLYPAFFPTTVTPGQSFNFLPITPLTFSISNGVALKYGIIKQGTLKLKYSNNASTVDSLDFLYVLPGITKNYQPLIIKERIPPGENSLTKTYILNGYHVDFTAGGLANFNTITQNYTVSTSPYAAPMELTLGKGAKVEISYTDIIPQYAKGYFGQQNVPVNIDTAVFDVFKNFNATNFQLKDATLDFTLINEFGAEFNGSLYNIHSINTVNQNSVALNTQQLSSININRAFELGGQINPAVKLINLNKNNSNILPFISNLPNKIAYAGNVKLNPLGNTSGYQDFAYFNTGIKVMADIKIPMRFNASSFILRSDAAINLSNLEQLDIVNYGNIIISAKNGYPFDAILQAYMVDASNTIIDSLFLNTNNKIDKGITDAQNMVIAQTSQKLYIPVTTEKIANIKKSKSIKIKAILVMPPNPPDIIIKDTYEIDIDMIIDLNCKVKRK
jgi:hypothetical protein